MPILPPVYLDCVVALGFDTSDEKVKYLATGFLVGRPLPARKHLFEVFLATNRHVLEGEKRMNVRFNPDAEENACEFSVDLLDAEGEPVWLGHEKVDVAVLGLRAPRLREEGIRFSFFKTDEEALDLRRTADLGFCEGDGVYVLGFPLGLVGEHRNYAVVRQGCIARIRDSLVGGTKEFLVDATVFPGNSGGPVVSRPDTGIPESRGPRGRSYLLGIVSSYVPYRDVAISQQTKRTRVVFEENSGLTAVIPGEYLIHIVEEASAALAEQRPAESVAITEEPDRMKDRPVGM